MRIPETRESPQMIRQLKPSAKGEEMALTGPFHGPQMLDREENAVSPACLAFHPRAALRKKCEAF